MEEQKLERLANLFYQTLSEHEEGLSYIDGQKIFYLLKRRLNSDNNIAESLPYYWYIHGPMSTVASNTFYYCKQNDIAKGTPTEVGGQIYQLGTENPPEIEEDEDYSEALEELEAVLQEYDISGSLDERLREDIYVDAPFEFQPYFKFEVIPAFEEFEVNPIFPSPDELKTKIAYAEASLPLESEFDEFNQIYSRYSTLVSLYLDEISSEESPGYSRVLDLTDDIWRLFASKLRLENHDDYYGSKVSDWEEDYQQRLISLRRNLDDFQSFLAEQFNVYSAGNGSPNSESAEGYS